MLLQGQIYIHETLLTKQYSEFGTIEQHRTDNDFVHVQGLAGSAILLDLSLDLGFYKE